jgi:hypothetical protein
MELSMFRTHSRSGEDFFVGAYENLDAKRPGAAAPVANAVRAFGHVAANIVRHVLNAMYEARQQQAAAVLERYGHSLGSEAQPEARGSRTRRYARETQSNSSPIDTFVGQAVQGMRIRCSITGAPCEGDRAYLCDEWGCARKGGLSPISHENFL